MNVKPLLFFTVLMYYGKVIGQVSYARLKQDSNIYLLLGKPYTGQAIFREAHKDIEVTLAFYLDRGVIYGYHLDYNGNDICHTTASYNSRAKKGEINKFDKDGGLKINILYDSVYYQDMWWEKAPVPIAKDTFINFTTQVKTYYSNGQLKTLSQSDDSILYVRAWDSSGIKTKSEMYAGIHVNILFRKTQNVLQYVISRDGAARYFIDTWVDNDSCNLGINFNTTGGIGGMSYCIWGKFILVQNWFEDKNRLEERRYITNKRKNIKVWNRSGILKTSMDADRYEKYFRNK